MPDTVTAELPAALEEAARMLEAGELAIVVDRAACGGQGRGVFLHAAALATEGVVNRAILHGRGLTCFSVTPARAMRLGLMMAGAEPVGCAGPLFLRSVEAAECDGTGISAADRALTLRAAGAPGAGMASLKSPGHVLPAMVREGTAGVAEHAHTVLTRLTTHEVAAWCDILDDDGEVAGAAWCVALAARVGVPLVEV